MKRRWQNVGKVLVKSKDSLLAHLPKCTLFAPPPPPKKKFCISIVFNFSWDGYPGEIKVMQISELFLEMFTSRLLV